MTEKEIRDIVKAELKKSMKDEAKKADKKYMTEKEFKEMIKKTMLSYHRWMWEKKGMWMSQI